MNTYQIKSYLYELAKQTENSNPKDQKKAKLLIHELKQKHRRTAMNVLKGIPTTDSKINKLSDKLTKIQKDDYVLKSKTNFIRRFIYKLQNLFSNRIGINLFLSEIKKTPPPAQSKGSSSSPSFKISTPPSFTKKTESFKSPYKPKTPLNLEKSVEEIEESNTLPSLQVPLDEQSELKAFLSTPEKIKSPQKDPISVKKPALFPTPQKTPTPPTIKVIKNTPKRKIKAVSFSSPGNHSGVTFTPSISSRQPKDSSRKPKDFWEEVSKNIIIPTYDFQKMVDPAYASNNSIDICHQLPYGRLDE